MVQLPCRHANHFIAVGESSLWLSATQHDSERSALAVDRPQHAAAPVQVGEIAPVLPPLPPLLLPLEGRRPVVDKRSVKTDDEGPLSFPPILSASRSRRRDPPCLPSSDRSTPAIS